MNRRQLIAAIERAIRTEVWSAACGLWIQVDEGALLHQLVNYDGRLRQYQARITEAGILRIG